MIIGYFEIATGLGIVAFWVLFFSVGMAPAHAPQTYFAFEHSFVLADSVLSLSLLVAGSLTLKTLPSARVLSLMCAGSLIFLGLVDFGFNVRNDIYTGNFLDGALSAAVNLWCLAIGIATGIVLGQVSPLNARDLT
jgi:hypothetical protein